ncbi:MAG TPA: hypothetical protein DDY77_03955 [Clostridiales bacterium]|nr:hypothetical protein [Clostridiales bacterium]
MDGFFYKRLVEAGYASLKAAAEEVNDLNVFPIPDGDTGDNMCSTVAGGLKVAPTDEDISVVSAKIADGMVLGARGNSGVILSQIFKGLATGLNGIKTADVKDFVKALSSAVETAYKAVEKPVEGTILTVLKSSVEAVNRLIDGHLDEETLFLTLYERSVTAVEETIEQLFVLKEAGVVDSGGKGLSYIFKGFLSAIRGEEVAAFDGETVNGGGAKELDLSLFDENSVMQFGYCTEFLLRLQTSKIDVNSFDTEKFIEEIKTFGDSIVCFKNGTIVKVHVHTFNPGDVLNRCQKYGEFLTIKIENMTLQHEGTINSAASGKQKFKKNAVRKGFGVVAVATGNGLKDTFKELGADIVIDGGQGKNPSTEDFLESYDALNADNIFVLPDNGNILPVAEKSAEIYKKSKVYVLPAKSIGDGYAALSALDLSCENAEEITAAMTEAMKGSKTIEVCKAVRSTTVGGVEIAEGEYISFCGKQMLTADGDKLKAAIDGVKKLKTDENEFLIAIIGKDAFNETEQTLEKFSEAFNDLEVYTLEGGQDAFDFVLILQ